MQTLLRTPAGVPWLLREQPAGGVDANVAEKPESGDAEQGRKLLCAACRHPVTTSAARTSVSGSHQHTFFNPHGVVFNVGCFSQAPGASARGIPTDEFTWFPGHVWQLAVCARCVSHLGWRFKSQASEFYGLILDKLVEGPGE